MNLCEPVEADVLLQHPEVLGHRLEGVHLPTVSHCRRRDQGEDPDVTADVEHDVAWTKEPLSEGQLPRLVALIEDSPLNVVS